MKPVYKGVYRPVSRVDIEHYQTIELKENTMYRTDKEMLRRISGNDIQGSMAVLKYMHWQKDESISRWTEGHPWIMNKNDLMERALTLPYCDFLNKELKENEWFSWTETLDSDWAADKSCLPDEWAFDEFVFSIKETIDMQTVLNEKFGVKELVHTDTKEASMWCYISTAESQRKALEYVNKVLRIGGEETQGYEISESMNAAYLSLFIKYDNEPTIYHWDGWFMPMHKRRTRDSLGCNSYSSHSRNIGKKKIILCGSNTLNTKANL